eukprot:scaffold161931_cov31-Attheya_sp.AAC.1
MRPRKAQKGMGGPPLSRLLTGQAMVSDTTTTFNYENSATLEGTCSIINNSYLLAMEGELV